MILGALGDNEGEQMHNKYIVCLEIASGINNYPYTNLGKENTSIQTYTNNQGSEKLFFGIVDLRTPLPTIASEVPWSQFLI